MTRTRRLAIAAVLTVSALTLAYYFIEIRLQPLKICPGAYDVTCPWPDEILFLGPVSVDPPAGSELARFHGKSVYERGLFALNGYRPLTAVLGGILLPLLLLGSAVFLVFRHRQEPSQTAS